MIGEFHATGVRLRYVHSEDGAFWAADIHFQDCGFMQDEVTEGEIHTRYCMSDPVKAVRTILSDASHFRIVIDRNTDDKIVLYHSHYSEEKRHLGWESVVQKAADELGMCCIIDIYEGRPPSEWH